MESPIGGSSTGHAAVGYVMGHRYADGTRPELVRIKYRRNGSTRTRVVVRNSGRVEFSDTTSVQFRTANNETVTIDELLGAEIIPQQQS